MLSVVSISLGASCGALLRWVLGTRLNHLLPAMPLGTLAANLIGGYLIGIAVEFFGKHPSLCRNNVVHKVSDFFSDDEDCEVQGGKGKKSSKRKRSQFQEASPPKLRHKRFL